MSVLKETIKKFYSQKYSIVETLGKAPIMKNWTALLSDRKMSGGNWETANEAGFVIPADICVIDVDPRNFPDGQDSLEALSKEINFDLKYYASYVTHTASGGLHLYYSKKPSLRLPNEDKRFAGVEFKSKGRQVLIGGSVLPDGRTYKEDEDQNDLNNLIDLPENIYKTVEAKTRSNAITTGAGFKNNEYDIKRLKELLAQTEPAIQGQSGDEHTFKVCCYGKDYGVTGDKFFDILQDWNNRCDPPWSEAELMQKIRNAYAYSGNSSGAYGVENMFEEMEGAIEQKVLTDAEAKIQEDNTIDWQQELTECKNGGYHKTLKNSVIFIKNDEHLKGRLAFNQFSGDKVWLYPPFWLDNSEDKNFLPNGRMFSDHDAIEIRYLLNNYAFDIGTNLIYEAIIKVTHANNYHPVRQWMSKNSVWDGVSRIDTFFNKYCGADQNKYSQEVARKMFCGIVARVFQPGCKFDYLPIFVGEQGIGKSTLLKALSIHPSWFCDNIGDITNMKDLIPQTRGKLIIEWQELTLFNKIDINHSKSFLSTATDRVREAYQREAKDYPRQFIVIATTNQDKFLLDETGNRRMLPIELKKINLKAVVEDLPQIYAEAQHLYKKGEKLYIDDMEALTIAESIRQDRFKSDELEEMIVDWLDNMPDDLPAEVTKERLQAMDIVIHCLKEAPARARGLSNRVAMILKRLGYRRKSCRLNGKVKQFFVK